MRVSLESIGHEYRNESVRRKSGGHSSKAGNTGSSITSFEDMLAINMGGEEMISFGNDTIVQASELSVKELTELYIRLGINSPAGTKINPYSYGDDEIGNTIPANQTVGMTDNVSYPECNINVPEKYVRIFQDAAAEYSLPYELLVSVAKAESDFNRYDTSRSGAMGIMQLMPATAKYLGVTDAYDPEQNIMGGARYLSEKLARHGSVELALAAYNAGSNAVEKYGGIPPYSETQNYVKKIMGYLGAGNS